MRRRTDAESDQSDPTPRPPSVYAAYTQQNTCLGNTPTPDFRRIHFKQVKQNTEESDKGSRCFDQMLINYTRVIPLVPSKEAGPITLGVDFPFFSTIVLFKNQLFPWVFDGFLKRRIELHKHRQTRGVALSCFACPWLPSAHRTAKAAGSLFNVSEGRGSVQGQGTTGM